MTSPTTKSHLSSNLNNNLSKTTSFLSLHPVPLLCLAIETLRSGGHMGGNHSSLFWLPLPHTKFSAVQKQCRHLACSLPGKQTHPQSPRGSVSAKATPVEPCLTSSGQKSWTPSDELRPCKSSSVYWTQTTSVAARQSNSGRNSWVPLVETVPARSSNLLSAEPKQP